MKHQWIEDRLMEISRSKSDLAAALSLPPSRVTEIILGKRQIKLNELSALAYFLEVPVLHLLLMLEGPAASQRGIKPHRTPIFLWVIGELTMGSQTMSLWPRQHHYLITFPLPERIQTDHCFLLEAPPLSDTGIKQLNLYQSTKPLSPNWYQLTQQLHPKNNRLLKTIRME